jgi:hypothetical protein
MTLRTTSRAEDRNILEEAELCQWWVQGARYWVYFIGVGQQGALL